MVRFASAARTLGLELPLARLVGGGEVGGNRERAGAGGGPFTAADEGGDEADAFLRVVAVAVGGVEDAALAVVGGEDHGLVVAAAAFGWVGVGRGQDVHVLAGATELVVQLVVDVQPLAGHAAGDRMLGVTDGDLKGVLRAVMTAGAFGIVADKLAAIIEIDIGAAFLGPAAPAAKADHFVVLLPVGEGVVSRVDAGEAAAAFDVIDKGVLRF